MKAIFKRSDGDISCNVCDATVPEDSTYAQITDSGVSVCAWCVVELNKRLSIFLMTGAP